jgi:hypothetical protein
VGGHGRQGTRALSVVLQSLTGHTDATRARSTCIRKASYLARPRANYNELRQISDKGLSKRNGLGQARSLLETFLRWLFFHSRPGFDRVAVSDRERLGSRCSMSQGRGRP